MKILLIVDDYLPHSIKVAAKMMHELACEFVHKGHSVSVITPDCSLNDNFKKDVLDGITVYYFKSGEIKNVNLVKRAMNELLLSYRAWKYLKHHLKYENYDQIIYYSPSIFFGLLVRKLKKKYNCQSYLILRDLFPQWVVDNGTISRYSPVTLFFRVFEKINYRYADCIALQSPKNLDWFNYNHNIDLKKRTVLLYNWAKNHKIEPSGSFRQKYCLEGKVLFFYGGNIGRAQDMSNIIRLSEKLKSKQKAYFVILGEGDEVEFVQKAIIEKQLNNILYLKSVNQDVFKSILAEVDVGLFTLASNHKTHNFPGKLLGYMVQNIPILGSINPGNDLKETIENFKAGFVSENGEDEIFYQNATRLLNDDNLRKKMGENSGKMLEELFTVEAAANSILKEYRAIGK